MGTARTAVMKRKERIVRRLAGGIAYLFKKNGVETVQGFGSLAGGGKIEVKGDDGSRPVYAKNIIIATGSEPRSLPGIEIDGRAVITIDGKDHDVPAGHLIRLPANVSHAVRAAERFKMLLIMIRNRD